jgi:hypothetical protein
MRVFTQRMLIGLMLLGAAAHAVITTIDPGNLGEGATVGTYIAGSLYNVSGVRTLDAALNTWLNVGISSGSVGQFRVVDAGGGLYNVETRISSTNPAPAPGLLGSTGTATPSVSFVNQAVAIDRGILYAGSATFDWVSNRQYRNLVVNIPAGTNYPVFFGFGSSGTTVSMNLAGDGTVTIASERARFNGVNTTYVAGSVGGDHSLTSPQAILVYAMVSSKPQGANWWNIDGARASSLTQFTPAYHKFYLLPGDWNLIGDLSSGSWLNGDSTVNFPLDAVALNWSETLTRIDSNGIAHTFTFMVPEPAALGLLALAGALSLRRRPRR